MAQLLASTNNSLQMHSAPSDDDLDLLHQTLDSSSSRNSHSLAEDHLEDILSLPLAQELHSRRSHAKLSHASSLSSLTHEPLPRAPPPPVASSSSPARRPQKASRSNSPELWNWPISPPARGPQPTKIPLSRARSRSRGAGEQLGVASRGERAAGEGWETIQVGSSSPSSSPAVIRARPIKAAAPVAGGASSAGMQRSRTAGSLPPSQPLSFPSTSPNNSNKIPPLPLTPPTLPNGANSIRKRAHTSNLLSSPASSTTTTTSSKRALSPSPRSASVPLSPASPSPTPRPPKPSSTPSPPAPSTKKARRKSFSAATSYRIGELERGDEPVPAAPWLQESPRVFRDQEGGMGAFKSEGRVEDMVLPAVARRLEAERLARGLAKEGGEGLITHWDREGAPMVVSSLIGGRGGGGSGSGRGTPRAVELEAGEGQEREGGEDQREEEQSNDISHDTQQPKPSSASANTNAEHHRTSLPPPQLPQKDPPPHQLLPPPPSAVNDNHERQQQAQAHASADARGEGEKRRSKEQAQAQARVERDRAEQKGKGCCAACVVM